MKHVSEYILEITQLQTLLQSRLNEQEALISTITANPDSISTLASMPKLEADLCVSQALSGRINKVIHAANSHR